VVSVPGRAAVDLQRVSRNTAPGIAGPDRQHRWTLSDVSFVPGYLLVASEEITRLRKSRRMTLAAGVIRAMIAWEAGQSGAGPPLDQAARRNLLDYAEGMLFLLVAMTCINTMTNRNVCET